MHNGGKLGDRLIDVTGFAVGERVIGVLESGKATVARLASGLAGWLDGL